MATITADQFLKDFNLPEVNKICRKINDYSAVLSSGLPTIGSIKKIYGYDFTQAYIEGWIVNLRDFINVGKKMNDNQCYETAYLILETYPFLSIADINLIFKKAKLGKYGSMYDRLDGQMILSWFELHFSERCEAASNLSMREADKYKESQRVASSQSIFNDFEEKHKFK